MTNHLKYKKMCLNTKKTSFCHLRYAYLKWEKDWLWKELNDLLLLSNVQIFTIYVKLRGLEPKNKKKNHQSVTNYYTYLTQANVKWILPSNFAEVV